MSKWKNILILQWLHCFVLAICCFIILLIKKVKKKNINKEILYNNQQQQQKQKKVIEKLSFMAFMLWMVFFLIKKLFETFNYSASLFWYVGSVFHMNSASFIIWSFFKLFYLAWHLCMSINYVATVAKKAFDIWSEMEHWSMNY